MHQVLTFLGRLIGIGPEVGMRLQTSWESFDAYGTVPAGETVTLRLPAGPISIGFESNERTSRGTDEDLPSIIGARGEELPVELMGRMQGPVVHKQGMFSEHHMRKRFATAELPYDGDYVVRAEARTVMIGTAGFSRKPRPAPVGPGRASA